MDNTKTRLIAIYLPQFHPIPENDKAWGKGFTEWRNVAQAVSQFPKHYQPHIPADLGFYDLRLDEIRKEQIELAKQYGIYGFCYYYYWFNGRKVLETPINKLLMNEKLNFPFSICWANENWTRKWDGHEEDIILHQNHCDEDDKNFIESLFPFFQDNRYIRINGKLLLSIYRTDLFPDIKRTAQIWRQEVRKAGLGELYLTRMESFVKGVLPQEIGFDAAIEFAPDWSQMGNRIDLSKITPNTKEMRIFSYKKLSKNMAAREPSQYKLFRCVTPAWDNTARQGNKSLVLINSTPKLYEEWLTKIIKYTKQNLAGDEKIVFINAWNEWAEGNHLEPDCKYGHQYLNATKNALIIEDEFASSENKLVSIIIPTFNQIEYTKKCIESIYSNTKNFELIVVDNSSKDGTENYLEQCSNNYDNFRFIINKNNVGFPQAINQGIIEAKGEYILIANNDIVLTNNWLERLKEIGENSSRIGIVGPISNEVSGLQKDENAKYKSIEEMHKYAANVTKTNKGEILNFPRIAFLCTLIKKEVIEKIGGLDERFTPGNYEDDDFCLRAQLAGFKTVIAKDVFIHHYGSKSFKAEGINKYADQLEINKQKFIGKWGVTPDELWIQRKEIKPHQYYYPINKNKFDEHFERTKILLADQELDLACESIQKALENFNEVENRKNQIELNDLLDLAGNLALANGDIELAQKYFEEELNIQPNSSTACAGLGEVFAVQGLFENAKTMFEWAIKNDPNNQTAIDSLALANKELGFEPTHNSLEEESA